MPHTQVVVNLGDLDGPNGNAHFILRKVEMSLKVNGHEDLVRAYRKEATSGDYQNLLDVTMRYVVVEHE